MDLKSLTLEELTEECALWGEKPYRARQIYAWMHSRLAVSYDEMTDLSKAFREKLAAWPLTVLEKAEMQTSALDGTRKYLFRLSDGNMIESVLMPYHHGN